MFCVKKEGALVIQENHLGCSDRDKWQSPLKVYQRHKGMGFEAQTLIWHSLDDNGLSWDLTLQGSPVGQGKHWEMWS